MKKTCILFTLCLTLFFASAQQSNESIDFNNYTQEVSNQAHLAYKSNKYALAASTLKGWFARYEQLSLSVKRSVDNYKSGIEYNLACYTALAGQKAEALAWFDKAVDHGYRDYANASVDSDLISLRSDTHFKEQLEIVRERGDYGYVLSKSGPYNRHQGGLPAFTYQAATAPELVALKAKFNLDSVAGSVDEISKFKNLLHWAHNVVRHDGNSNNPPSRNAIDLIAVCQKENRGVNCRMMATILRDVYQAEGFKTRIVTCMPKDTADFDCHVITVVWSASLNKWVWMDPTFNAYVSDDKGNLLNIEEVRERLISGAPLVLNDDANWNNQQKETKDYYLGYYMSKNLYWLKCSVKSEWDIETRAQGKPAIEYVNLYPGNFSTIHQAKREQSGIVEYATNNPAYFWQKPEMQ